MDTQPDVAEYAQYLQIGVRRIFSSCSPDIRPAGPDDLLREEAHQHSEILFCLDGECEHMLSGRIFALRPGDVLVIRPWEQHSYNYGRPWDQDLIQIWCNILTNTLYINLFHIKPSGIAMHHRVRDIHIPPDLETLLLRRWQMLHSLEQLTPEWETRMLLAPLNALIDELLLYASFPSLRRSPNPRKLVNTMVDFIENHLGCDCSLAQLEKVFGYTRAHLAHLFRANMNCSIGDYINRVRIRYADAALIRGKLQKEIAEELGFATPGSFWGWLQRHRHEMRFFSGVDAANVSRKP